MLRPFRAGLYLAFNPGRSGPNFYIHRALALAFHGQPPTLEHEVAHGDGDRDNNVVSNVRWATRKENAQDRVRHGTTAFGKRRITAEKEAEVAEAVRWRHLLHLSEAQVAEWCGVGRDTVARVRRHGARQPVGS